MALGLGGAGIPWLGAMLWLGFGSKGILMLEVGSVAPLVEKVFYSPSKPAERVAFPPSEQAVGWLVAPVGSASWNICASWESSLHLLVSNDYWKWQVWLRSL